MEAMKPMATSYGEIRPWNSQDAEALVKYANNRQIWLNLRDGFPHPYTIDQARAFIGKVSQQNPLLIFAIAIPEEAIGSIGLSRNQDVHRFTAELGYWLGEPYWGQGIMTETVSRIVEYGFEQLGLIRIYAEPYAHNTGSCRVLEKAGFELEGRLRSSVYKDGRIMDQFLYAIVKSCSTR